MKPRSFHTLLEQGATKEALMEHFALNESEYRRVMDSINRIKADRMKAETETEKDRIMKEWRAAKERGEEMIANGEIDWDTHASIMRSYESKLKSIGVNL